MSELTDLLYRTNTSIVDACRELGIEYNPEDLEDLETCSLCGIWWFSYQLAVDDEGLNNCKFCETHYGS
jgi:hypothetical protein